MSTILEQFELNQTFFIEFGIIAVLFAFLSNGYFKHFLKLFEARHKRTVEDREAAEKLIAQATAKFDEYKEKISLERVAAKQDYEMILTAVKKEEAAIIGAARNEAKKITQDAIESAAKQTDLVKKQLQNDVEALAKTVSDNLLKSNLKSSRPGPS